MNADPGYYYRTLEDPFVYSRNGRTLVLKEWATIRERRLQWVDVHSAPVIAEVTFGKLVVTLRLQAHWEMRRRASVYVRAMRMKMRKHGLYKLTSRLSRTKPFTWWWLVEPSTWNLKGNVTEHVTTIEIGTLLPTVWLHIHAAGFTVGLPE